MTEVKRFLGEFKLIDENGNEIIYDKGDVVLFKGNQFIATERISEFSPLHGERSGWKKFNSNRSINFTNSDTPPEVAHEGDHWFDSTTGRLLIYIKDVDTEQWVEL